jgi:hypothetical protein
MSPTPPARHHHTQDTSTLYDPEKGARYPVRLRLSAGVRAAVHGATAAPDSHAACGRSCGIVPVNWLFPPDTKITCKACLTRLAPDQPEAAAA